MANHRDGQYAFPEKAVERLRKRRGFGLVRPPKNGGDSPKYPWYLNRPKKGPLSASSAPRDYFTGTQSFSGNAIKRPFSWNPAGVPKERANYQIAQETGVHQATLSRFMSGERGLSQEAIDALAEFFDLELVPRRTRKGR